MYDLHFITHLTESTTNNKVSTKKLKNTIKVMGVREKEKTTHHTPQPAVGMENVCRRYHHMMRWEKKNKEMFRIFVFFSWFYSINSSPPSFLSIYSEEKTVAVPLFSPGALLST